MQIVVVVLAVSIYTALVLYAVAHAICMVLGICIAWETGRLLHSWDKASIIPKNKCGPLVLWIAFLTMALMLGPVAAVVWLVVDANRKLLPRNLRTTLEICGSGPIIIVGDKKRESS